MAAQVGALPLPLPGRHFAGLAARAYDPAVPPDLMAGSTEIYLSTWCGHTVLTWRGSTDRADWWADLTARPTYAPELGCRVHAGFLACARVAAAELWHWLGANPGPIILCGHSKGAAEATLAAALMVRQGRPPAALVTFGSPRCGFSGLRALLCGVDIRRYVHGRDPVPCVPCVLGWSHVAPALAIGRGGNPLTDHVIERYIGALSPGPMSASAAE